jgi:Cu+-exporting ATPase
MVLDPHANDPSNVLRLNYSPSAPEFTIRTILSTISTSASPPVSVAIVRPPSADEISRGMYRKEQMKLLLRLTAAVVISIPIFIIGIVYMSLVKEDNPGRHFFEERLWAGQVSRGEWVLFILATPIMFYCASVSGCSSPPIPCLLPVRNSTVDHFRNCGSCGNREVEPR